MTRLGFFYIFAGERIDELKLETMRHRQAPKNKGKEKEWFAINTERSKYQRHLPNIMSIILWEYDDLKMCDTTSIMQF